MRVLPLFSFPKVYLSPGWHAFVGARCKVVEMASLSKVGDRNSIQTVHSSNCPPISRTCSKSASFGCCGGVSSLPSTSKKRVVIRGLTSSLRGRRSGEGAEGTCRLRRQAVPLDREVSEVIGLSAARRYQERLIFHIDSHFWTHNGISHLPCLS